MLGTAAADKRHVVFDTPHDVRLRRADLVREVLDWSDSTWEKCSDRLSECSSNILSQSVGELRDDGVGEGDDVGFDGLGGAS